MDEIKVVEEFEALIVDEEPTEVVPNKKVIKKAMNSVTLITIGYLIALNFGTFMYAIWGSVFLLNESSSMNSFLDILGIGYLIGVVFAMVLTLTYRVKHKMKDMFVKVNKMNAKLYLSFFALMLGSSFITNIAMLSFEYSINNYGFTVSEQLEAVTNISYGVLMGIYICVIGPLAEELLFRGTILKRLEKHGKVFAIVISSVLFGLIHGNLIQFFFATMTGIILGYVTLNYSLKAAIILHIVNNSFSIVIDQLTPYIPNIDVVAVLLMIVCLIYGLYFLVSNRKNIKEYTIENRTQIGTYPIAFKSFWFLAFSVLTILFSFVYGIAML